MRGKGRIRLGFVDLELSHQLEEAQGLFLQPHGRECRFLHDGGAVLRRALQLRERIRNLIRNLPAGNPARVEGEREIARLDKIAFVGEVRGHTAEAGLTPLPSLGRDPRDNH